MAAVNDRTQEGGAGVVPPDRQADLLARISHEIRTPLNAMTGYAELLGRTELNEQQQLYVSRIVKGSQDLVALLDAWLCKEVRLEDVLEADRYPVVSAVPGSAAANRAFTMLVVEDSALIRDLFTDIFNEEHCTVLTAASAADGLQLARAQMPQLIFIDLHLADSDGWQLARTLRANPETASIPLVVMTGQTLKGEEFRPLFDEFLQKPFQLKPLRALVQYWKTHLDKKRQAADSARETDLLASIRPFWDMQMRRRLLSLTHTGSLPVAIELGHSLEDAGAYYGCEALRETGRRLLRAASTPDIAALDALIDQLKPLLENEKP